MAVMIDETQWQKMKTAKRATDAENIKLRKAFELATGETDVDAYLARSGKTEQSTSLTDTEIGIEWEA